MGFEPKKSTSDATSVKGQMATPVTHVSQATTARPLEEQVQPKQEVKIESVPKDQVEFYQLSEDDILLDASIVAKPLMMNESYKIKVRDPGLYAYYWGEFKAKQGLRFSQLKAMGFVPASPDEILEHQASVQDGKLVLGDVMLLKMPKQKYMAHLKNNMMKSMDMMNPQKAMNAAKARAGTLVTGARGMPSMGKHKGEIFIPEGGDVRDLPVSANSAVEQRVYEEVTRD